MAARSTAPEAPAAGDRPIPKDNPGRDNYLTEFNQFNQDLHATLVLAERAKTFPIPPAARSLSARRRAGTPCS